MFGFSTVAFGQIWSSIGLPLRSTISPEMRCAGMTCSVSGQGGVGTIKNPFISS